MKKPFMSDRETNFLENLINLGNKRVLEWGSGWSTVYFPEKCDVDSWTAIEHDKNWYEEIKDEVSDKVDLQLRDLEDDYTEVEGDFDLIIIDGRKRKECFLNAVKTTALIVLHDSGRKRYWDWYKDYSHEIIFEGEGWLGDGWDHRGMALFYGN